MAETKNRPETRGINHVQLRQQQTFSPRNLRGKQAHEGQEHRNGSRRLDHKDVPRPAATIKPALRRRREPQEGGGRFFTWQDRPGPRQSVRRHDGLATLSARAAREHERALGDASGAVAMCAGRPGPHVLLLVDGADELDEAARFRGPTVALGAPPGLDGADLLLQRGDGADELAAASTTTVLRAPVTTAHSAPLLSPLLLASAGWLGGLALSKALVVSTHIH